MVLIWWVDPFRLLIVFADDLQKGIRIRRLVSLARLERAKRLADATLLGASGDRYHDAVRMAAERGRKRDLLFRSRVRRLNIGSAEMLDKTPL